jgi:hypothetical protein
MTRHFSATFLMAFICASLSVGAQDLPQMDPEAMKILQSYQQQQENIPAEMLALMPPGLALTEKKWYVEVSSKMLLQLDLKSFMGSTNLENSENYALDFRLDLTAYNLNSVPGKMTADQSLDLQRREVQSNWIDTHQESQIDEIVNSKPEAIQIPQGQLLIQKIVSKAHQEGEGTVPEKTSYCGFLYLEMENGYLTAEMQPVPNTKVGIEKWLKHVAGTAAKLKLGKYFE